MLDANNTNLCEARQANYRWCSVEWYGVERVLLQRRSICKTEVVESPEAVEADV